MTTSISATHSGPTTLSGLASGLNTSQIITDLMAVAQQPVTALQGRVTTDQADITAWGTIATQLNTLQSAVDALKNPSDVAAMASAGSSSSAVDPVVTGSPAPGSMSFTVDQLATAHELVSATTFGSASTLVGAGTFSITSGGATTDFTTTSGTTLGQLAQQISTSSAGISAAFTASGTQAALSSFNILQQGQDAKVTLGSGANAVQLSRSSNQINDLMPGVSLNLVTTSATPVTVTVQQNVSAVVTAVQAVVTAYNTATSTIASMTGYDTSTNTAGQLAEDSTAQALGGQLNDAISNVVSGLTGPYTSAASIGITMQQDGSLALNQSTLFSAMTANPNAVISLLSRTGSSTDGRISSVAGTDLTQAGSYGVVVTAAATAASVTGASYAAPGADQTFTIQAGAQTATVNLSAGDNESTALGKINTALKAAGVTQLTAQDNGSGAIQLQDTQFGSASTFTVAGSAGLGLDGTFAGTDVAGTINGVAATGSGQVLSSSTGITNGLTLTITATAADVSGAGGSLDLGNATLTQGVMGNMSTLLNNTLGLTGTVADATNMYSSEISDFQGQEADMQVALNQQQQMLQEQFAAMETALASLQAESASLNASFGNAISSTSQAVGGNANSGSSSSSSSSSSGSGTIG